MTATADLPQELIDRGLQLTPAARRHFAELLLDSVDYTPAELNAELDRRWEEYASGKVQAIPIDDFIRQLDRRIEERGRK